MQIKPSEKKPGSGIDSTKMIGFFKGTLITCNPSAEKLKELYKLEETPEEPKYTGKNKKEEDWAMISLLFEEEIQKTLVPYRIFISKEVAEFEVEQGGEKVMRTWYINQHGESQLVYDKKDLFRSFTHLQKWDKESSKMVDVLDNNGDPIELSWRKAYKGEKQLYSLLRKLVTQDWFQADADTSLSIKIDSLMRGNVKDISTWIGTENYQSVVGCIEIAAKDGENGVEYYQNCVDDAWMPGWKIKEANLTTASNSWNTYDDKAKGKGKGRDIYQFYNAVKRNKNITELKAIHEFRAEDHLAAGSSTISHSDNTDVSDTDY